jgi:hypothetical protein
MYRCEKVEHANTQLELYIQISDTTNSRDEMRSTRRNVSPQIRSSTLHGTIQQSCVEAQRHTGLLLYIVKISHPESPVV